MSFEKFNLSPELGMGLSDLKFKEPTPIQDECIPLIMEGHDVIGAAQTGTGKTGAFVIPIIQKIMENQGDFTQALILSPTRELAQQIDEQVFALGYHTPVTSATIIGGSDFAAQARSIRANVDIIVATPGRLLDQMNVTGIDFSNLNYLVLDEADRMLDMGFIPDVTSIVNSLPKERQTMLFSATMSGEVMKVVDKVMKPNPQKVEFEISKPVDSVDQRAYHVHPKDKLKLIDHLFDSLEWETCIIFTATKKGTDELQRTLKKRDIPAISIHGDRSQDERNEALRAFKNKKYPVIVATDVLSRGIDIDNVSVIINYDVPNTTDDYIHRVGRTGRYDKTGTAVTFVTNRDKKYFNDIKRVVGDQLTIYEDLDSALADKARSNGSKSEVRSPKSEVRSAESEGRSAESEGSSGRTKVDRSQLPERPSPSGSSESQEEGKSGKDQESEKQEQQEQQEKQKQQEQEQKRKEQEARQKEKEKEEEKRKKEQEKQKRREERQRQKEQKLKEQQEKQKQQAKEQSSDDGRRTSGRSDRRDRSKGGNGQPADSKRAAGKRQDETKRLPDYMQPEIVEKAVNRNKRARKPAKGIWGIIKSLIPKIKS